MRELSKIFFILTTAICGLFCGCHEGFETRCYDSSQYVFFKIISTTDIDSVHFFLNNQRVCEVGLSEKEYLCNDSTKKVPVYIQPTSEIVPDGCKLQNDMWICTEKKDGLSMMREFEYNADNCVVSDDYPVWNIFSCGLGPLEGVDFDSSKMSIEFFIKEKVNRLETEFVVMGGNNIKVIPEQDSAKWFSYKENLLDQIYDSPELSNRAGCYDGYCVTTLPIEKEEFCYDLSN